MSLSVIARAPVRSRPVAQWSRSMHVSRPVRSSHGAYTAEDAVPFSSKSKPMFALKLIGFLGFGFSIPVLASAYQLWKKS
ncbi:hypothetical protein BDZ89DRAFT_1152983 [Hymenopellis radicata]|nr:hypothetical protein BDZ89DRAFT_1152983 [Hymenopellis radicata]